MKALLAVIGLGVLLVGCEKSPSEFETTKSLAEKGDAEAQAELGWMYYTGRGMKKDTVTAYA